MGKVAPFPNIQLRSSRSINRLFTGEESIHRKSLMETMYIQTWETELKCWHKGKCNTLLAGKLGGCSNRMLHNIQRLPAETFPDDLVAVVGFLLRRLDVPSRQFTQRIDAKKSTNQMFTPIQHRITEFRHSKIGGNKRINIMIVIAIIIIKLKRGFHTGSEVISIVVQELNSSLVGVSKPRRPSRKERNNITIPCFNLLFPTILARGIITQSCGQKHGLGLGQIKELLSGGSLITSWETNTSDSP